MSCRPHSRSEPIRFYFLSMRCTFIISFFSVWIFFSCCKYFHSAKLRNCQFSLPFSAILPAVQVFCVFDWLFYLFLFTIFVRLRVIFHLFWNNFTLSKLNCLKHPIWTSEIYFSSFVLLLVLLTLFSCVFSTFQCHPLFTTWKVFGWPWFSYLARKKLDFAILFLNINSCL